MCHILMTRSHGSQEAFIKNDVCPPHTHTSMQLRHLSLLSSSQQASKELTEVLNQIWSLDANRLRPGTDYVISLQVRHKSLKLSHMVQMHVMVYSAQKNPLLMQIHSAPGNYKDTPLPQLFDEVFIVHLSMFECLKCRNFVDCARNNQYNQ